MLLSWTILNLLVQFEIYWDELFTLPIPPVSIEPFPMSREKLKKRPAENMWVHFQFETKAGLPLLWSETIDSAVHVYWCSALFQIATRIEYRRNWKPHTSLYACMHAAHTHTATHTYIHSTDIKNFSLCCIVGSYWNGFVTLSIVGRTGDGTYLVRAEYHTALRWLVINSKTK